MAKGFCLEVSGPYACFTRPEFKVERVSYDFITPSAARAVFDSVFWKPAIKWHIKEIEVLNPIQFMNIGRNEIKSKAAKEPIIRSKDTILQRNSLILKDVKYRIHGEFEFIPPEKRSKVNNPLPDYLKDKDEEEMIRKEKEESERRKENPETETKYLGIFLRRARKGQCFHQPYLGCKEFPADFKFIEHPELDPSQPVDITKDFGYVLFDINYQNPKNIIPMFYKANMEKGRVEVPMNGEGVIS